jgi:hypothetical protein
LTVIGSTIATDFEAYVEQVLCPSLKSGEVTMMDNLPAHTEVRVKELIEQRGCELFT